MQLSALLASSILATRWAAVPTQLQMIVGPHAMPTPILTLQAAPNLLCVCPVQVSRHALRQSLHGVQDIRDTPLRNPHLNIMAVLVIAARLVWGLEGFHEGNHLLLRETPRFPGGFPPPPAWQAWAHRVVRRQLTPYLAPEQVRIDRRISAVCLSVGLKASNEAAPAVQKLVLVPYHELGVVTACSYEHEGNDAHQPPGHTIHPAHVILQS